MFPLTAHHNAIERFAFEGALTTASFYLANMGLLNFKPFTSHTRAISHDIVLDLKVALPARKPRPQRPQRKAVHLPVEIIMHILEAGYFSDEFKPDDQLLRNCALVCRVWSGPAQKLLFRSVTLRDQLAFDSFKLAIDSSSDKGTMLADSVVRMRVVLDHNQPGHLSETSFARAVASCPKLYELGLFIYGRGPSGGCSGIGNDVRDSIVDSTLSRPSPSFSRNTLSRLRLGPRIAALQYGSSCADDEYLFQLLDVWPSVRSLEVRGVPPQLPATASISYSGALEELHMNFQSKPSTDFMNWLLQNSGRSMRILDLEREPSNDLLEHLVGRHASTLESLALPSCCSRESAAVVGQCEKLKEFRVEHSLGTPLVYKMLPEGIQHVALGVDRDTPLEAVLSMVKTRDELQVLTLQVWEGGLRHPAMPSLKMECAARGIELRITRDVRVFRTMIRGDPVPSVSFPRMKSLSNVQHMRAVSL
ncbi:hypothetical protein NEOLEDRAFT_1157641 [Neolentinus lepideus HHB14362 ss-1]|uniref:F-box domain-containing protein n=1 Tax=Neolentinus lepideus HHB14362 ss-1 TaxID=1314782 RepID=A0A165QMG1_9AGAM|nr:hypothetical protein NEOLEDRAFT_1157641 [Neolentinus lepideus HHB14362 ss-1]